MRRPNRKMFVQMPDEEEAQGPLCDDCVSTLAADGGESYEGD